MDNQITRLIRRKKTAELTIITGVLVLIASYFIYQSTSAGLVSGVSVVIGLLLIFFGNSNFSHLRETFKEEFISELLKEWMKGGSYNPTIGLSQLQVYNSESFKNAHHYHSEGLITGAVDKIPFLSSDIKLFAVEDHKNMPYFSGRIFIFEFNRAFTFSLQLMQDLSPQPKRNYRESKTLNDLLNNRFACYTTNVNEARKLLSTECREALLSLDDNHDNTINLSFVDSKVYISFNHQQDTFTFRFFKPLNKKKLVLMQNDVEIIHTLIDEIRLNNKIFSQF